MKYSSILIAALALPATLALAQTPAPTTSTSSIPYIPLIGSTSSSTTSGASTSSAWFIDVAAKLVVFCSQSPTTTTGGTAGFTCTAQPVPTSATGATPAPAPSAGTPGASQ